MPRRSLAALAVAIAFPHPGWAAASPDPVDASRVAAQQGGIAALPSRSPDVPPRELGGIEPNSDASEAPCAVQSPIARSGGLTGVAPDGTGTTAQTRVCVSLAGVRKAAQVGRTIEISDGATGPLSGPGISTAASASYALSLVNVRPNWAASQTTGEADGLNIFVRQANSDTAALLANVGVRSGFATTLESYTFAADSRGRPLRAVRTQLGVVNARDGGEYGLVLQAADGHQLTAGLRIASIGDANWRNYLEAVSPTGEQVAYIRGSDGAIVGGDLVPTADLRKNIGTPERRYAISYTRVLQLAASPFADLPKCGQGAGGGALAFVSDARKPVRSWGQIVSAGGGSYKTFVKCDGANWMAF